MRSTVVFIATYDTKGKESDFIKKKIIENGADCISVDVGVGGLPASEPDITLADLSCGTEYTPDKIRSLPRGEAVIIISNLLESYIIKMFKQNKIDAIIGIGGAGGTQIATQVMRKLPFGLPKIMLTTLASGNTRRYIEDSDIAMMPSISDISGLNCISKVVFERFAAVCAKSAQWYKENYAYHRANLEDKSKLRISQTMYGTTTEGVTKARKILEKAGFETIVFHASGAGGRTMESFIYDGVISGVLDMTIAEIGGYLVGGLHNAGPKRMEAAVAMGIPLVIVPGAADTIVLPPMSELQDKFKEGRILNLHNPTMTTMRTNVEENISIADFLISKLKDAKSPVKIFIPKGGLSSIDKPGKRFYLPEANEALFKTLIEGFKGTTVEVIEDARHIDEDGFGEDAADMLIELMKTKYNL